MLYAHDEVTGRLLSVTYPHASGDTTPPRETYGYNILGQRTSLTDANGNTTRYSYDTLGRLSEVSNPLVETVRYVYNAVGQVTSIRNGLGNSTRFVYNDLGQLERKIWPDNNYERYAYDANGNLQYQYLPDTTLANETDNPYNFFDYDNMSRLVYEDYHDGTEYFYSYTAQGLTDAVYAGAEIDEDTLVTDYAYDDLQRPVSIVNHLDTDNNLSVHYQYDANNNRIGLQTRINGTNQSYVGYAYDLLNRLTAVTEYDASLPDPTTDLEPEISSFIYDENNLFGTLSCIERPNDVDTSYAYDPYRYFVSEIEHTNGITPLEHYTYQYDDLGNRISSTDELREETLGYDYDKANRLISETRAGAVVASYSYDAAGNRRTENRSGVGLSTYTYNANDQLCPASSTRLTPMIIGAIWRLSRVSWAARLMPTTRATN